MKWKTILLVSLALFTCSLVVSAFPRQDQGYRDEVIKYVDEVWTKGNLAYIDQLMDPEFVRFGHTDEGNAVGIAAFKDRVRQLRSSFTDYNVTLIDMTGIGDRAVFNWRLRGNYVGPDKKLAPGRAVDITGRTAWLFHGNKVIREVVDMDDQEYYRQIQMAVPYSEVANRALVLSYLYEVVGRGNVSALDELVASNHILHDANYKTVNGVGPLREHVLAMREAFGDLSIAIHDVIADGNLVTARWTLTGTHKGEWNGFAPTGRRIEASGILFATIKNDKIQETWNSWDTVVLRAKTAR